VTTEYVTRTDANATAKIPDDGNRGWLGSRYSEPPGAPLGAPDGRPQPPDEYTSDDVNRKAFWHRMGDVGYLDDQNRFWFCGRMSQRVVIPWRTGDRATLFTIPCEAIFNRHHDVYRSALIGVGSKEQVVPAIVVEPLLGRMPRGNTARMKLYGELLELAESSPLTAGIESIMICKSLPVDVRHNVKINRELLAIWATKKRLSRLP
jgi:acyl-coenzyme A synthetase/AMP-(fatty) acid ligase